MLEPWTCTQDHEASHIVCAWLLADRIDVIGDLYITMENDRRVAVAGVRADPHLISPVNAAKVGIAGFLGEARGSVIRAGGEATVINPEGIATEILGHITGFMSGLVPEDEAWRMHVQVDSPSNEQTPVFTLDDLMNVAGWTAGYGNHKMMTKLIVETIQVLQTSVNWKAILQISESIPDTDYVTVSSQILRQRLQELLPREW